MRKTFVLLAASTALLAMPALAQLGTVADVNVGGQVGVDPGTAVGSVTDPVGQTVDRVDGTVNNAADATGLALATREQVSTGAEIRDSRGNSIGTVQSIDGETAMVTRGGKMYHVPLSGIYHSAAGKTRGLVTKMPRADIKAHTAAAAEAR